MEPQPHGGFLQRGATCKGAGRKPERLKRAARRALGRNLDQAEEILGGRMRVTVGKNGELLDGWVPTTAKERMMAADVLARIGLSNHVNPADVMARLEETLAMLARLLGSQTELLDSITDEMGQIWKR